MQRYGKKDAGNGSTSFGLVDNLTMDHIGNQLTKVTDAVANFVYIESADFKDYSNAATEYTYNRNGAMKSDLNKGITEIQYNSLNLPRQMVINSSSVKAKNYYTYSASGVKLRTEQRYDPTLQLSPVQTTTPATDGFTDYKNTDYVGNIIYEAEKKGTAVTNKTRILVDGGYIENNGYHYYLTDHLGNNRMIVNQNGVKTQWNHYYPFGTAFADKYDNGTNQPYKYNGKELDQMHGLNLYDYSARYYESAIGRFTTVDPLAEKYYSISPYAYCANNPLRYVDLKGDSLTYHGDRDAAINMHNTHLGGYYTTSIDENGLVSMSAVSGMDLSKMTPEQKAYADVLDAVVNGTDGMTTIDIVENSSDVLIGDLQLSAIDVGDISKLPQSGLLPSNGMGAMIHEVKEQYNVQVVNRGDKSSNLKNWKAHMGGSNTESKVVGAGINPDRPTTTFPSGSKDGYIDVSSNKGNARIHFRNYNVTGVSYFK